MDCVITKPETCCRAFKAPSPPFGFLLRRPSVGLTKCLKISGEYLKGSAAYLKPIFLRVVCNREFLKLWSVKKHCICVEAIPWGARTAFNL